MQPIDVVTAQLPLLLNDFFKYQHRNARLSVFLCGRKPEDPHFDLRKQVARLLQHRMGCRAFLGEEIEQLRFGPQPDVNHLTIEVQEATQSDLVVMFLGSEGTLSEVTAFAMSEAINPKVVVFNDIQYRDVDSFVNLGPLRLLRKDQIIYYDVADEIPSVDLVKHLDKIVEASSIAAAATSPIPSITWEYVSMVCVIVACPNISCTIFGFTFFESSSVAQVCLRE